MDSETNAPNNRRYYDYGWVVITGRVFAKPLTYLESASPPLESIPLPSRSLRSAFQLKEYALSLGVRLIAWTDACGLTVMATSRYRQWNLSLAPAAKIGTRGVQSCCLTY